MNHQLLEALEEASIYGFDAPKCKSCNGSKRISRNSLKMWPWSHEVNSITCLKCNGTGFDASDSEKIIGRVLFLLANNGAAPSIFRTNITTSCCKDLIHYDKTQEGLAIALLKAFINAD